MKIFVTLSFLFIVIITCPFLDGCSKPVGKNHPEHISGVVLEKSVKSVYSRAGRIEYFYVTIVETNSYVVSEGVYNHTSVGEKIYVAE